MAPSKQFYLNDIMIQISCTWSFAHVIFWMFYAWEYSYNEIGTVVRKREKILAEDVPWITSALASKKTLMVPVVFFILAFLFYLLGCLLDYQQYDMNGNTFYFGLTDVNDVNRQWYYALGLALLCLQSVIFIYGGWTKIAVANYIKNATKQ